MTEDMLEKELRAFDYSTFSKVKDSLLAELLQMHRKDNAGKSKGLPQRFLDRKMTEDELDYATAAGTPETMQFLTEAQKTKQP